MSTVRFGNLAVGEIPRVVGTLCSLDSVQKFAALRQKHCDIAEVRLDEVGTSGHWLHGCQAIEASGTPVILTLRAANEGGKSDLSDEQRVDILCGAVEYVSAIDVELQSSL